MKISDLIKKLQALKKEHGDLPVVLPCGDEFNQSEAFPELHHAEEDKHWKSRLIICPGKQFNPEK